MLVTFRSPATETVTMFGNVAVQLLKLMGATGRVPGGLSAEEVPAAWRRLAAEIEKMKTSPRAEPLPRPADPEDRTADKDQASQQPIPLATRAVPLLSLLERAATARAAVVWESGR